jgi:hypothetical protein
VDNSIKLIPADSDLDLKLDYIKSIFSAITIATVKTELGAKFTNVMSYLGFKTAALCSMFIGENETRAAALDNEAADAINRSLGIVTKGRQAIASRRRPFRAAYKMRGGNF